MSADRMTPTMLHRIDLDENGRTDSVPEEPIAQVLRELRAIRGTLDLVVEAQRDIGERQTKIEEKIDDMMRVLDAQSHHLDTLTAAEIKRQHREHAEGKL